MNISSVEAVYTGNELQRYFEAAFQQRHDEQETRNTALIERIETCTQQITRLQRQNEDFNSRFTDLATENSEFRQTMADQLSQINQLRQECQFLQRDLDITRHALIEKDEEIATAQERIETCEREKRELLQDNTELRDTKTTLESTNNDLLNRQCDLNARLRTLENEKQTLDNEKAELERQKNELERQKNELERQKNEQQTQIDQLQQELGQAEVRYSDLERGDKSVILERTKTILDQMLKMRLLKQETDLHRNNLVQEQTEHARTNQQRNQIQQTLNQTQTELSATQRRYQELERTLEELRTDVNTRTAWFERRLNDLNGEAVLRQQDMRNLITQFCSINLNNLQEIQQWANRCRTVFGFTEDERRTLENNLSALARRDSFFSFHKLLRDTLAFGAGGASVYYFPLIIRLILPLIK
jgi:chromosome segregation ATPase